MAKSTLQTKGMSTPPPIVEALLGKVPLTPADYGELARLDYKATAAAFTASGLSNLSLVAKLQKDLVQAVASGQSLGSFKAQVGKKLQETMGDKRLELIYRINVHQSYMAGRWQGIQDAKVDFEYLQYDALNDGRTRPSHQALDGLVYPVDSSFWQSHYPPNGFRCRCNVRQISSTELKRRGLKVSGTAPQNQPQPDAGWNGNQARDQVQYLLGLEAKKLESLPLDFARRYILEKNRRDPSFKYFVKGEGVKGEMRPVGVIERSRAAEMGAESQLVFFKTAVAAKQQRKHPDIGPNVYLTVLNRVLSTDPKMIVNAKSGKQYFYKLRGENKFWKAVVRVEPEGLLLISLHKTKAGNLATEIKRSVESQKR